MLSLPLEVTEVEAGVVEALADGSEEATVEAVEVVLEFTPRRSPTSEPRSLRMLPLEVAGADVAVEVESATAEAEAEAGTEDAELDVEVVESTPRRPPRPEPMSATMLPLELVVDAGVDETWAAADETWGAVDETWAAESTVGVAVEAAAAGVEVVESPPSKLPRPEPRSPSRLLSLEVEAGALEALDEATAAAGWLVLSVLEEAAAALLLVSSATAASVCLVVVVRVAVGSPPTVVVPVMRWVISGFLGSTEMVTTTTSCPWGSWAAAEVVSGVGVASGAMEELWVGIKLSKKPSKNEPGLLSALRALLRMVRLTSLGK